MKENNRLIQVVLSDINFNKLKCEEELERVINSNELNIDIKLEQIKGLLEEINKYNNMGMIWASYTSIKTLNDEK